jgi:polyphosphate kinase 2 (PPK2 family)
LTENGITFLNFFSTSKGRTKKSFLARIETPEKNWKFSAGDAKERAFWDDICRLTSTRFKIPARKTRRGMSFPADKKWFTRVAVSEIILKKMESLDLQYPKIN